jgi:transposase-like protein
VAAALEQVWTEYKREGKEQLFDDLRIFIAGGAERPPAYAELSRRLGVTESTIRSQVTRLRARYREALRTEVRRTVNTETQVDQELRELLRVLTGM